MSTKHDSDAKKVFEMVQSLKSRYGMKEPDPPVEDEPEAMDPIESEELPVSPEAEEIKEAAPAPEEPEAIDEPEAPERAEEMIPGNELEAKGLEDEELPEEDLDDDAVPEERTPTAEELSEAIDSALNAEFSEENTLATEDLEKEPEEMSEEEAPEEELPEDLIYEEAAPEESAAETGDETEESPEEEDPGIDDQIAIDVPEAEELESAEEDLTPEEDSEEEAPVDSPEAAAIQDEPAEPEAPSPAPASQQEAPFERYEEFRPMRSAPLIREQKPIAAEQLSLVNPPVMKEEGAAKAEEMPSVEALERSTPDLSKLSDEERRRRSGLSDEDIGMMLEFGYEDDLNRVLGYRTVRKQKYNAEKAQNNRMDLRPFAYAGKEYDGSVEGRNKILRAYHRDKRYLLIRLFATGLCTLLILVYYLLIRYLPEGNKASWLLFPSEILLLAFVVLIALLSHRTLIDAYKSLIFFSPTPHAILAILFPFALVSAVATFFVVKDEHFLTLPMVCFVAGFAFFLSAVGDLFRYSTEKHAFLVLSAASQKIAPEPYVQRKKKLQRGQKIVSLIDDSPEYAEYRIRPVGRITGFFRRCGNLSNSTGSFSILLSLSFGLSVFGTLIAWMFHEGTAEEIISTFVYLLFFTAPISSIFAFFYPAVLASRRLSRERSAILGEESIEELTRKKAMLFSDSRVFKAGKCVQIPLRNDSSFKEDLRLSGILFRKIGGVLAEVATPLFPEGPDPAVSILRIREDGIEALVENRYHLLAGSKDYLLRHGIRFPSRIAEEPKWRSADTAILYVAVDDVLKLRYEVEYQRLDDFEKLLHSFGASQTAAGIYTYDPNLTEAFLRRLYGNEQAPVLVKPGAFDEETEVYVTDAPAVTLGKDESLVSPARNAAIIKRARKIGFRVQLAAMSLGALLITILSATGIAAQIVEKAAPAATEAAAQAATQAATQGGLGILNLGTLIAFHLASLVLTWGVITAQFNQPHS